MGHAARDVAAALWPLRDMDGVIGSALYGEGGELVAHDFPVGIEVERLHDMGVRVHRLMQAFGSERGPRTTTLVFGAHRVLWRDLGGASIAVLLDARGSTSALDVALRVAARDLAAYASESAATPPHSVLAGRSYRGRPI